MQITPEWIFGALCLLIYAVFHIGRKIESAILDVKSEISSMDMNMRRIFYDFQNKNNLDNIHESIIDLKNCVGKIDRKIEEPPKRYPDYNL